jgi:outer membrane immunogenic protein
MKTILRTLAPFAIIAAVPTAPAGAADLYRRAPDYAPAPLFFNWTGFYVGANLGYQWGKVTNWPSTEPSGITGGGQLGYNWQVHPNWVLGVEADIQGSGANDTFAAYKFSNPWFGTVRGRVGYAMNNVLFYATGGVAYGGIKVEFGPSTEWQTHLGWTAGGGVEVGLTPNWSAKAEYLYVRLEDQGYVLTGVQNGLQSNIFRLGVNYRF